jgi:flagellar basal-body rod protein FlgF
MQLPKGDYPLSRDFQNKNKSGIRIMENSLYVGISRQLALTNSMDMIANNVANMSTPGYRAQNPIFKEFITNTSGDRGRLSMVYDYGQWQSTTAGPAHFTGGTYDVALSGPGFMGITTPTGETMYTRAGNFTVSSSNQLVNSAGYTVAGSTGAAISIPPDAREVKITDDGDVTADGNVVGRIMMMEFENLQSLKPQGNGLYSATGGLPATETKMKQGMLEGSNVNPVLEMTRMIDILRNYQSTQKMISAEDERQRSGIQKLANPT